MTYVVLCTVCAILVGPVVDWAVKPVYSKPRREPRHWPGFEVILKK